MIKEALKYIVGLKEPFTEEINGELYADKPMERIVKEPYAEAFNLTTLSSLVEYIKSGADTMKGKMFVHVISPTSIEVFSALDKDRKREFVTIVRAKTPKIDFNSYVEREQFNIALQSKFLQNTDRDIMLKLVGTVQNGTVQQYSDDGVSQKATIKTGIASTGDVLVPNPVNLRPYRTFAEVEQPESAFVFRMRDSRAGGVECAIFEADGGAWELEAMENIKNYLEAALAGMDGYIVIS